uniref:Putative UDP-3-O-acylglucosamine N-acyltransferase 2 n=1 Tax=Rhizophora mucronata TaxID=61149 RepID=A0A2P2KIN1_RHIMU
MAASLQRLSILGTFFPIYRLIHKNSTVEHFHTFHTHRHYSGSSSLDRAEDRPGLSHEDFSKWRNGGGVFHKSACIDRSVLIEIGSVVHSKAVLAANVIVGSGSVIGPDVTVGQLTKIGYNVALSNCSIGDSCIIHNGVCIGQDGFGFFVDDQGQMVKKPQVGYFLT